MPVEVRIVIIFSGGIPAIVGNNLLLDLGGSYLVCSVLYINYTSI